MTYRDPETALRERSSQLQQELDGGPGDGDRADLTEKRAALEAKLAKHKALGAELAKRRGLPMLDTVKIAAPCSASWAAMEGDNQSRFCGSCEKHVYNLSAMTREQAEVLILEKEGDLCVRLFRRTDGTVMTADCPVGVRRKRLRLVSVLSISAAAIAAAAGYATFSRVTATTGKMMQGEVEAVHEVQGGLAPLPPTVAPVPEMGEAAPSAPSVSASASAAQRAPTVPSTRKAR